MKGHKKKNFGELKPESKTIKKGAALKKGGAHLGGGKADRFAGDDDSNAFSADQDEDAAGELQNFDNEEHADDSVGD